MSNATVEMVKPPTKNRWWYWLLVTVAVILAALPGLGRELWFDESLTLLEFALPLSWSQIYTTYPIPNNQIGYTYILKFSDLIWSDPLVWRLGALLGMWLGCLGLFNYLTRRCSNLTSLVLTLAWVVTPAFGIYAVALRAYGWSTLALILALMMLERCREKFSWINGTLYFLTQIFLFALLPTNLWVAGALLIWVFGSDYREIWRNKVFWWCGILSLVAFALFYGPIFEQLLGCVALKEGWHNRYMALIAVVGGFLSAFWMLLVGYRVRSKYDWRWLLWLIPPVLILIMPVAPFPRVFVVWWPLGIIMCSSSIDRLLGGNAKRSMTLLVLILANGVVLHTFRETWSEVLAEGARQDDYFAPYYVRNKFRPSKVIAEIERLTFGRKPVLVFSFDADPYAGKLYGILADWEPRDLERLDWMYREGLEPGMIVVRALDEGTTGEAKLQERLEAAGGLQLNALGTTDFWRFDQLK